MCTGYFILIICAVAAFTQDAFHIPDSQDRDYLIQDDPIFMNQMRLAEAHRFFLSDNYGVLPPSHEKEEEPACRLMCSKAHGPGSSALTM